MKRYYLTPIKTEKCNDPTFYKNQKSIMGQRLVIVAFDINKKGTPDEKSIINFKMEIWCDKATARIFNE